MSYEYCRIPFKKGINLICGPNGAGKSSILLAISVALGQTSTERGKRLRDLIRHGKEIARISLIIDNSKINGRRPFPSNSDEVMISRYIKKNGEYWYELDYKKIDKEEIVDVFKKFGISPDNMLIIMHQNTMEKFALTSPEEKLRMLEEAVGIHDYRRKLLEAEEKLRRVEEEEKKIKEEISEMEKNANYWDEQYKKYLKKAELIKRKRELENELIWAKVFEKEERKKNLEEKYREKEREEEEIKKEIEDIGERIKDIERGFNEWWAIIRKIFYSNKEIEFEGMRKELEKRIEKFVEYKVKLEILKFKLGVIKKEKKEIKEKLVLINEKLKELLKISGKRIYTDRKVKEIENELEIINAHIEAIKVPIEAEEMYKRFSEIMKDLKKKEEIVKRNKERGIKEIERRKKIWRKKINDIVKNIEKIYNEILKKIGANGKLEIIGNGIENAGLQIKVGFGSSLFPLDAYTQSGGERSVCIMALLLALQNYLKSPFRGIDEFDLHMDPKNRETIYKMILSSMKEGQSFIITPSQLTFFDEDMNLIIVQKTGGKSTVMEVER